ncbi:MAG: type II secretion system F family protein, partial [Bacilli bacterium]
MTKKKMALAKKIYREDIINQMQTRIDLLGYKDTYDATIFLNIRLLTSTFLFFMVLYLFEWGYVAAPLITFLYYNLLPKMVIDKKVLKRRKKLDGEAMYFFEVLTLALESGRNIAGAIVLTSNSVDGVLADEFKKAMEEVNYGKSLGEALISLKKRIPSDTINNIILNMSQANLFGN